MTMNIGVLPLVTFSGANYVNKVLDELKIKEDSKLVIDALKNVVVTLNNSPPSPPKKKKKEKRKSPYK